MDSIESVKKALQTIEKNDSDLTKWFGDIKITTTQEKTNYEEILGSAKIAYKKAKAVQDNLIEPLEDGIKRIKALFSPKLNEYTTAIKSIASVLDSYYTTQKQLSEEDVLKEAQEYIDKKREADKTGEIIPMPSLGVVSVAPTSKHNLGSTNYRPYIKVTIVNAPAVPREYCVPSETLLRKVGELALAQKLPMPHVEGAILEVHYPPRSIPIK